MLFERNFLENFDNCKRSQDLFGCDLQERSMGQRLNIILVAEGAIDCHGGSITADFVKKVSFVLLRIFQ